MTPTCDIVNQQAIEYSGVAGNRRLMRGAQTTLDGLYLVAMVYHPSLHAEGLASQSHQSHRVQNVRGFSCHYSKGCWPNTQTPQLDSIGLWCFAFEWNECGIERRERPTLTTCGWPVYVTGVLYSTPGLHAQWAMNRPTYIVPLYVKRVRVRVTRAHRIKRSYGVVTQVRSGVMGNLSTLHRQTMTGGRKPRSAPSTDENLS